MAQNEPDSELSQEVQENIRAHLAHLLGYVVNLVRGKRGRPLTEPAGLASGFVVKKDDRYFLLSAGHAVNKHQWYWEMNVDLSDQRCCLCLPVGPFTLLKRFSLSEDGSSVTAKRKIDVGWCELDIKKLTKQFTADPRLTGKTLEIPAYHGPLDERPVANAELYSFAAWNRGLLIPVGVLLLERSPSFEVGMRFVRENKHGKYVFKLGRSHQGHAYYKGASGAPIATPDGKIISMVLGGSSKRNEIYGLPLADYGSLLALCTNTI
jgi:hypothetical protein